MALELNRPDKADHYLMQIACEVRRVLSQDPNKIQIPEFKLTFGEPDPSRTLTREQKTELAKQAVLARIKGDMGRGAPQRARNGRRNRT